MKPVSPVIPGENFEEIIVAEHQDEYGNLPSISCGNGVILTRWELSDEEIETIAVTKSVWLYMHSFGRPVTPISLQVEPPGIENKTPLEWEVAVEHFKNTRAIYQDLVGTPGVNTSFALEAVFRPIAERFERGERTVELYEAMMSVE